MSGSGGDRGATRGLQGDGLRAGRSCAVLVLICPIDCHLRMAKTKGKAHLMIVLDFVTLSVSQGRGGAAAHAHLWSPWSGPPRPAYGQLVRPTI